MEYRVSLPLDNDSFIPDLLKSVSPQWLLSTLFSFIRAKLRSKPTGEQVGQPEWPLSVALAPTLTEWRSLSSLLQQICQLREGEDQK